jgi:glycosyltransferase involved in cell wall biosynthesis
MEFGNKDILFAGCFINDVKDPELAKAAVECLKQQNRRVNGHVELVELKGYIRSEVAMLLNASDCMLLTSHQEGSPQVVKETMACCCPVVSVDVGDVATTIGGLDGFVITTREPADIAA